MFSVGSFRKRLVPLLSYRSPEFSGWHWCLASVTVLKCPTEVDHRSSRVGTGAKVSGPSADTIRTTLAPGRTVENLVWSLG